MNKNVVGIVIALIVACIFAGNAGASPQELWIKTFGGDGDYRAGPVRQTSDSGYIISGGIFGADKNNAFLIKTDEKGNELWNSTLEGTGFVSVRQTWDGGYILAGKKSNGTGSVAWLARADADGNQQWSRTFGGEGDNDISSVQQTPEGGFILAGFKSTSGKDVVSGDGWLIKTDASGKEKWNKTFGGEGIDGFDSIYLIRDGGFIIAGSSTSYGPENAYGYSSSKAWLIKTDENGKELWNKTFDGEGDAASVQETTDSGYILAGSAPSWLLKTDNNGNEQWRKTLGEGSDSTNAVLQTTNGGYVLAGTTFDPDVQAWLVKTDANGNTEWKHVFGRKDIDVAQDVQQTKDGGYIVAGTTNWRGPKSDAWLIKVGETGALTSVSATTLFDINYWDPGWIVLAVMVILGAVIGLSTYYQDKRCYATIILSIISLVTILLINYKVISVGDSGYPPVVMASVMAVIMVFVAMTTYMKRYYPYSTVFSALIVALMYVSTIKYIIHSDASSYISLIIVMLPNLAVIPISIKAASWHDEKIGFIYPVVLSAILGIISGVNLPPSTHEMWLSQLITFVLTIGALIISGTITLILVSIKFIKKDPGNSYVRSLKVSLSLAALFIMLMITFVYMYQLPDFLHQVKIL